jgi:hypothetical protein
MLAILGQLSLCENTNNSNIREIFDSLLRLGKSNIDLQELYESLSQLIQLNSVNRMESHPGGNLDVQSLL